MVSPDKPTLTTVRRKFRRLAAVSPRAACLLGIGKALALLEARPEIGVMFIDRGKPWALG